MMMTFTAIQERVRCHLNDTGGLIWTESMLESAVRSALRALSRIYEVDFVLSGLDDAVETTLPKEDEHALITGAVAYALTFRASGRFEDAVHNQDLPAALADWAGAHMARFQTMLAAIKGRTHQESTAAPYSEWEWEES
jgi:hypothetical protein